MTLPRNFPLARPRPLYRQWVIRVVLIACIALAISATSVLAAATPRVSGDVRGELRAVGARGAVQWERAAAVRGPWGAIGRGPRRSVVAADAGRYLRACVRRSCSRPTAMIPPISRTVPRIAGSGAVGATLAARPGAWAGAAASATSQWSWQRRDGDGWRIVATSVSYTPGRAGQVRVRQRVRNAGGWSAWVDSRVLEVRAATPPATPAPSSTRAPSITGEAREGAVLVADDGAWAEGSPVARVWLRCAGEDCRDTGAAGERYTLGAADIDFTMRLQVTAQGAGGTARATSSATATVLPGVPRNVAAPVISGTPGVDAVLTATEGTWQSARALTYAYQWQRCADATCAAPEAIAGATSPSYTTVAADAGWMLRVRVQASDDRAQSAVATSGAAAMIAPYAMGTPSLTGDARVGSTLSIAATWSGATRTTWSWRRQAQPLTTVSLGPTAASACLINGTGAVSCWGDNADGQVGDGTQVDRSTPVATGITDAAAVATGASNACVVHYSGSVSCWGSNSDGQLGAAGSGLARSLTPLTVSGVSDAIALAVGDAHVCAVRATGAVVCWGQGTNGQLGGGVSASTETPTAVTGIDDAIAVSAGRGFTCALHAAGGVSCFGLNDLLQLGNTALGGNNSNLPVAVDGVSNATDLTVGEGFACAIQGPGAVSCWGDNTQGQLGRGSAGAPSAPDPVSGGYLGVRRVMAMGEAACLENAAGAARCWGDNARGQLANGATIDASVPTAAPTLSAGLAGFGSMRQAGMALAASGGARSWGDNAQGQLGTGSPAALRPTPAAILISEPWVDLPDDASTRDVIGADAGTLIRGCATATNDGGSTSACTAPEPVAPASVRAPAVMGAVASGAQVMANAGAWRGAMTYAYQWQSCADAACTSPVDIDGATAVAYVIDVGLVGAWMRVRVMGAIDGRETSAVSAPVAVVS